MSTRWFFSSARVGVAADQPAGPTLETEVLFGRAFGGGPAQDVLAPGPGLSMVGPAEVLGFDRALVLREEPTPGTTSAPENVLASIEFAHADLPWLLSQTQVGTPAGPAAQPWLVLVVLAEDEAAPPRPGSPLPVLTAPAAALPPLAERWAWAHVEARLGDGVADAETARRLAADGVRRHSAGVVARLLCPRRLAPDRGWIAAVVPATAGGRATGLDRGLVGAPNADAWTAGAAGTVDIPVYHWWRFRTADAGTFEELARRLRFRPAAAAGLGARVIDVSRPWPTEDPIGPATAVLDGALRVPGSAAAEAWSDPAVQARFTELIRLRMAAPAHHRDGQEDAPVIGPPLYGAHHTGEPVAPEAGWLATLNVEVRRRVAAGLGARYVQLEQEFLMARAWDQVGEIRQANRLLAVAELAATAAERSQRKHFGELGPGELVTTLAPLASRVRITGPGIGQGLIDDGTTEATLTTALAASRVPTGMATTAFARMTRRGGALARRVERISSGAGPAGPSIIDRELDQDGMSERDGLPTQLRAGVDPTPLQLRRMRDRIPSEWLAQRSSIDPRPLAPIMAHPRFSVPMAEELFARWPEWAVPGIGAVPPDTVLLLETNPEFVAALLVGLNHEFNRELLWREYPTDQRGTPFARFWPTPGDDIDEIARWPLDTELAEQVRTGGAGELVLLVRGELLRRFPGTALHAVRGQGGRLPAAFSGIPATPVPLDESTVLFLVPGLTAARARAEDWFLVFREPMRATQFGFDSGAQPAMKTWADLTWNGVTLDGGRFVRLAPPPSRPTELPSNDPPGWGRDAADMARIAFQQPFQLAFRASALLSG